MEKYDEKHDGGGRRWGRALLLWPAMGRPGVSFADIRYADARTYAPTVLADR
jgi:hypothetical protein